MSEPCDVIRVENRINYPTFLSCVKIISVVCVLMISTSLKFYLNSMVIKRVGLIMSPHMY